MCFGTAGKIKFLSENKNKILISGIIGSVILLLDVVSNVRNSIPFFTMFFSIEFISSLVATILCFLYYFNNKKILPLISGILFSISLLYHISTIIFILSVIFIFDFFVFHTILTDIFRIILVVLCFFVFVKNKNKSV